MSLSISTYVVGSIRSPLSDYGPCVAFGAYRFLPNGQLRLNGEFDGFKLGSVLIRRLFFLWQVCYLFSVIYLRIMRIMS